MNKDMIVEVGIPFDSKNESKKAEAIMQLGTALSNLTISLDKEAKGVDIRLTQFKEKITGLVILVDFK